MSSHNYRLPLQVLTGIGSGGTAYSTPVNLSRWQHKTMWILPVGGDPITIDIEMKINGVENNTFYPFLSYSGGTGQPNKIFGLTLDGDVLDDIRVKVVAGVTAPSAVYVVFYGGA